MKRLSLTQRLTLVIALMLVISSTLILFIQDTNRTQYSDAMIQNLSRELASSIAKSSPLMNAQGFAVPAVKTLFGKMMSYNPSVEVYLLDSQGNILANDAPAGHMRHQKIDIHPLQALLNGAPLPVYGSDPRSMSALKVFSAAPIQDGNRTVGYLYVILQGENYQQLQQGVLASVLRSSMFWSVIVVLVCGLTAGACAFYWVTRPVRTLTQQVTAQAGAPQSIIEQLAAIPYSAQQDEVAQLKNAFINMARRIAAQVQALELKDKQRREFVANISHDLRTPLMSIQGYLETLSVKASSLSEDERSRYLRIALTQSEKVGMLAQQLFELARLEHGVVTPQRERFSLSDLVQDVMQKFELAIEQSQLRIDFDIESGIPLIEADMSMIERVLSNLVDNAIRHTPSGGIIRLRIWSETHKVMLELEDSGPGIAPAVSETLFERPSITDPNRRDNGGLGLVIVRRILQLHQGDISLIKAPGACFRIFVPL